MLVGGGDVGEVVGEEGAGVVGDGLVDEAVPPAGEEKEGGHDDEEGGASGGPRAGEGEAPRPDEEGLPPGKGRPDAPRLRPDRGFQAGRRGVGGELFPQGGAEGGAALPFGAAGGTGGEVGLDGEAGGEVEFAVEVTVEEGEGGVARHRRASCLRRARASARSFPRARERRDMTVPMGRSATTAISL